MIIKVDNVYLDFDEDIDTERKSKLFEEIDATQGDFSYSFTIQKTIKNVKAFELYSINQEGKIIYRQIPAQLLSNGVIIYDGFIKVEHARANEIDCSFFSGNTNWMAQIQGPVSDIDLSVYNLDITQANIENSWQNTSGIFFPIINAGVLATRGYYNLKVEDFHPFIYVKDIINEIFIQAGLKLDGKLLTDWRYQRIITSNGNFAVPEGELQNRSVKVGFDTGLTLADSEEVINFNLLTDPYYVGDFGNWDSVNDRYDPDVRMVVNVSILAEITYDASGFDPVLSGVVIKKGTEILKFAVQQATSDTTITINLILDDINLLPNEFLYVYFFVESPGTGSATLNFAEATFKVTYVYKVYPTSLLPSVTKQDFVAQVFSMFGTIINYDQYTKTVYVDFFRDIENNEEIDISNYVDQTTIEEDYSEFISNYGRYNYFLYGESDFPAIENYNSSNEVPYGGAMVDSFNENTEPEATVLELDVVAVYEDMSNPLAAYLPHVNFVELEEDEEIAITTVNDSSGVPSFVASGFAEGDLVRLSNSTVPTYNGDFVVTSSTGSAFTVRGLNYNGDADLTVHKLIYRQVRNSEQIFLLAVPDVPIDYFSAQSTIYIEQGPRGMVATAYFYKPLQGFAIDDLKESLSFGDINILDAHQLTMVDSYWNTFVKILRDPVKLTSDINLPENVFKSIDFKRPFRLKTATFNCKFYGNQITGYKNSYLPSEINLIKLS